MTLIVAIGCTDGVVLAADSAMQDVDSGTKQPHHKIRRIRELPILYGCSGDVGLQQSVDEQLQGFQPKPTLKRTRQDLKQLIAPELAQAVRYHVPYPQQGFHEPPACIALIVGILDRKPWILEVERNAGDTIYGDTFGHFAAIGSGKPWAQAIMRPHLSRERSLEEGKIFAYRVLEDSIDLAASGLAKPIHMHTITLDGVVAVVEQDEQDQSLAPVCELWRQLESEAVGRLFTKTSEEPMTKEAPVEIPEPDVTAEASPASRDPSE